MNVTELPAERSISIRSLIASLSYSDRIRMSAFWSDVSDSRKVGNVISRWIYMRAMAVNSCCI